MSTKSQVLATFVGGPWNLTQRVLDNDPYEYEVPMLFEQLPAWVPNVGVDPGETRMVRATYWRLDSAYTARHLRDPVGRRLVVYFFKEYRHG